MRARPGAVGDQKGGASGDISWVAWAGAGGACRTGEHLARDLTPEKDCDGFPLHSLDGQLHEAPCPQLCLLAEVEVDQKDDQNYGLLYCLGCLRAPVVGVACCWHQQSYTQAIVLH